MPGKNVRLEPSDQTRNRKANYQSIGSDWKTPEIQIIAIAK